MKNKLHQVTQFHKAFALPIAQQFPDNTAVSQGQLRHALLQEENNEYLEAIYNNDKVALADALADMLYVLCGTIITHGFQDKLEAVFNEVHSSNMSKLDENGLPIYREDGKVIKSKLYRKPNLEPLL